MRAVVQDGYGGPDRLRIAEVPAPVPGPGEVLVRVEATSVHADVWHMLAGVPYVARPAMGLRRPRHVIPGTDLAGVVEALGDGVTGLSVGDEVYGEVISGMQWTNGGTFAELACAPAAQLAPRPDRLSAVEAAAIPTPALIALLNVDEARITEGERVLVNGAAGGVGMFVVQLAIAAGAHVTAIDAGDRADALRALGADEVIDYRTTDYTEGTARYDAVIDIPGNQPFSRVSRILRPEGRYVLIGHDAYGTGGRRWFGSIPTFVGLMARVPFTPHLTRPSFARAHPEGWRRLVALVDEGAVTPVVDRVFPLDGAADAMRYLMSGQARGRVVLQV